MKLLIDEKGGTYLVKKGNDLHTKYGMIVADEIDNAKPGVRVTSNKEMTFNVVEPDLLDFIQKSKRGPQAVTLKDMGLIAAYGCISSGSKVVESGTGSGLLSMFLANIINPGELITYELREDFAEIAQSNFSRFGIDNINLKLQNIYEGIDEDNIDLLVLDLPEPWMVIPYFDSVRIGGRIISYSPSVNQVNKFVLELPHGFNYETFECIQRPWKPKTMRPDTRMLGHTGFLTVSRRLE